jgi:hypothetical protein
MKATLFTFLALLLFVSSSFADQEPSTTPQNVVRNAIVAVREDKLMMFLRSCDLAAVTTDPVHPMPRDFLLGLLWQLDENTVIFEPPAWDPISRRTILTMRVPKRMVFELINVPVSKYPMWTIVSVHPEAGQPAQDRSR